MKLKVAITSDHGGYVLKEFLKDSFDLDWVDLGTDDAKTSVDYPDFGHALAETVADGDADYGIAICGTGIGISIACNRHENIRAALCMNTTMARLTREHNDANVLCLGERLIGTEAALDIVKTFLETEFEGGRHLRRIDKIED
ncbi:MAG: ribose 5-phosphate isomerase B [Alphaproteobacteria bacterium]|nr:ribose 5-phosphate isomerase B [Alphaproteobacteria bacterium]